MPSIPPITTGYNNNFFQKLSVSVSSFNNLSDMLIPFQSQAVMLLNTGTGVIEFSFDGVDVHGELNSAEANAGISFDNRIVSGLWFRVQSGSSGPITLQCYAWGTR